MSPKNATKPSRSGQDSTAARVKNAGRFLWATHPRAIVISAICVMAAVALIAARQPSDGREVASVDAKPTANVPLDKAAVAARVEPKKTVVSKAPSLADVTKPPVTDASAGHTRTVEPEKATVVESGTSKASVQPPAPVTITGCLELDHETFWLKDTSGADAPKSRSWKSGFLKKRSSSIELVDAANTLKLSNHVGRRVAATGVLMNGEMRARSLQRIAASCG